MEISVNLCISFLFVFLSVGAICENLYVHIIECIVVQVVVVLSSSLVVA